MGLRELEEKFLYTEESDEEIDEKIEEEIEDRLEEASRQEILEDISDLEPEFREHVRDILDYMLLDTYEEEIREQEELGDEINQILDNMVENLSEDEINHLIGGFGEDFQQKIRERMSERS